MMVSASPLSGGRGLAFSLARFQAVEVILSVLVDQFVIRGEARLNFRRRFKPAGPVLFADAVFSDAEVPVTPLEDIFRRVAVVKCSQSTKAYQLKKFLILQLL